MGVDYGSELLDVRSLASFLSGTDVPAEDNVFQQGLDVQTALLEVMSRARGVSRGVILYFPPGRYFVARRSGEARSFYDFPENIQWLFAPGALLRPAEHVSLIIRGSIRAGLHQIFGYDRYAPLPAEVVGVNTVPMGRVLLHTSLIPSVYPEWWGATFNPNNPNSSAIGRLPQETDAQLRSRQARADRTLDCSDAVQAAIDAACVNRDDNDGSVRRPSIPVVFSSRYQCNQTLVVERPEHSPNLHLVLRGVQGPVPSSGAIVRVRGAFDTRPDQWVLRVGPGVNFDIQDVGFHTPAGRDAVNGCVDVVSHKSESGCRRGLLRRCELTSGTEWGFRLYGADDATLRQIVVDSCEISPRNIEYLTRRAVDVSANESLMLHIDGALMGSGQLRSDVNPFPLPPSATVYQVGGSVLVRATLFHAGVGPRPSRVDPATNRVALEVEDGQEVYLGPAVSDRPTSASHFTAMQCESQGWWFLARPFKGEDQVVLVAVSHANVNWGATENRERLAAIPGGSADVSNVGQPPSVVWLKEGGSCTFVACRFAQSVLTDSTAMQQITNAATFFGRPMGRQRPGVPSVQGVLGVPEQFRDYRVVEAIIRPPDFVLPYLPSPESDAFDGRIPYVVPIRRAP